MCVRTASLVRFAGIAPLRDDRTIEALAHNELVFKTYHMQGKDIGYSK